MRGLLMLTRIRFLLAAFDRGEFSEAGLSDRLERYLNERAQEPRVSRKPTKAGMPAVLWGEP
jgi:hypothetical protein